MNAARTEDPIDPPDDADRDWETALDMMTVFQRDIVELHAHTARTEARLASVVAENWRLIAEKGARDAPPAVWLPLKAAAADAMPAQTLTEVARNYQWALYACQQGKIVAERRGSSWYVRVDSLTAHAAARRGK